uniref:Uncharacterized protein n=1 Tax=Amphimedon queenslandica TaxID=400682 RepID=A0A1X7USP8_AMPQE
MLVVFWAFYDSSSRFLIICFKLMSFTNSRFVIRSETIMLLYKGHLGYQNM